MLLVCIVDGILFESRSVCADIVLACTAIGDSDQNSDDAMTMRCREQHMVSLFLFGIQTEELAATKACIWKMRNTSDPNDPRRLTPPKATTKARAMSSNNIL